MISLWLGNTVLIASLIVSVSTYLFVSRREGGYLNILTPSFLVIIPAYYLLPLFFAQVFGNDASPYAYVYVYTTLAVENIAFAYSYTRPVKKLIRLPLGYSYENFGWLAFGALGLAVLMYAPILLEFPEYILDPRQIYTHTRTGFGINFYTSSVLAYVAVILILFSRRSRIVKAGVVLASGAVLALHGSKGQVLSLVLLIALFEVYVKMRRVKFLPALLAGAAMGFFALLLMIATMTLGEGPAEVLESVSSYSDYTRNAMLVIDSNFPHSIRATHPGISDHRTDPPRPDAEQAQKLWRVVPGRMVLSAVYRRRCWVAGFRNWRAVCRLRSPCRGLPRFVFHVTGMAGSYFRHSIRSFPAPF